MIGSRARGANWHVFGIPRSTGFLFNWRCLGEEVCAGAGSETDVQVSRRDEESTYVGNELSRHGVELRVTESIPERCPGLRSGERGRRLRVAERRLHLGRSAKQPDDQLTKLTVVGGEVMESII